MSEKRKDTLSAIAIGAIIVGIGVLIGFFLSRLQQPPPSALPPFVKPFPPAEEPIPSPVPEPLPVTNKIDCIDKGYFWWSDGSCRVAPEPPYWVSPKCSIYRSMEECEANECFWWSDESCRSTPEPVGRPLQAAVVILKEIRDEINSTIPVGEVFNRREAVTTTEKLIEGYGVDGLGWTSFDMTNNGPSSVYFSVNRGEYLESPLRIGQSIHVDLKKKKAIKRIFLKCLNPGDAADVYFHVMR